jgi:hypothetical protein
MDKKSFVYWLFTKICSVMLFYFAIIAKNYLHFGRYKYKSLLLILMVFL